MLCTWFNKKFLKEGSGLDATYFCPHHPTKGIGVYRTLCKCRKPEPGMILAAVRDFNIDVGSSVLIGDRMSDILAGEAAGVGRSLLLSHNNLKHFTTNTVTNLLEVKKFL